MNQSFREHEEEDDYGEDQEPDAQIFAQTNIPEDGQQPYYE